MWPFSKDAPAKPTRFDNSKELLRILLEVEEEMQPEMAALNPTVRDAVAAVWVSAKSKAMARIEAEVKPKRTRGAKITVDEHKTTTTEPVTLQ